jgi:hypothetical protein
MLIKTADPQGLVNHARRHPLMILAHVDVTL